MTYKVYSEKGTSHWNQMLQEKKPNNAQLFKKKVPISLTVFNR